MLVCPVRNCQLPLERYEHQVRCSQGHSFDIARSGYLNLLQPQDRRSKAPGDTKQVVEARRRLHEAGLSHAFLSAVTDLVEPKTTDIVLDAGCGEGFYLGSLAGQYGFSAHGTDISVPAIEAAARRYGHCEWVVANADRFIPYADQSFSTILSITARQHAGEFHRLLRPSGRLLIALPGPQDLVEIRGLGRDRVPRILAEFGGRFRLIDQRRVTTCLPLKAEMVQDVLVTIYRPHRSHPAEPMTLTLSLDVMLFEMR